MRHHLLIRFLFITSLRKLKLIWSKKIRKKYELKRAGLIRTDLHDTTLSHATSLRTGLRDELFRVNQTYNSLTAVVYVKTIVVGF